MAGEALMGLSAAERQRRSRAHKKGDHSLCDPERCPDVTTPVTEPAEPVVTPGVTVEVPCTLGSRGRRLFRDFVDEHPGGLDARQRVVLEEAARTADRLERMDELIRGDLHTWASIVPDSGDGLELVVDKTLAEARAQQASLARLLSELRQTTAPAERPSGHDAPVADAQVGGGKLADLTARIAARRRSSPTG